MRALTGASGAGKYIDISSDTYPRLLDLLGQTVRWRKRWKKMIKQELKEKIKVLEGERING